MIEDVCCRISKGHVRVVTISYDSDFGNSRFFRKPLLWPADSGLGVSPCLDHVPIEAVGKYDT